MEKNEIDMKGKKISGFGAGELIGSVLSGIQTKAMNGEIEGRDDVLRDEFNDIIVDTVCAFDTHIWETGIKKEGDSGYTWVIVSQYKDRDEAVIKHKKWVEHMKKSLDKKPRDINLCDGLDVNE